MTKIKIKRYVDFADFNQGSCEYCVVAREIGPKAEKVHNMAFHSTKRDHALAMRIPLKLTDRMPKQIVADAEASWLGDYIIQ